MDYKKAFYSKLEECYLGAKIKAYEKANTAQNTQSNTSNAQSGFSNLLSIKEQYFSHIKAYLDSAIPNDDFNSHDIYNKLYTFFDSYLNDTGTPFFHDTPLYKNIYAKVYTNSKDTSLFYKTKDLYYVKSDTLYTSLALSDENELAQIYFDASEYRQNADNTKRKLIFKLDKIEQNSTDAQDSMPTIYIKVLSQKDLFPELNAVFKENSNEFKDEFIQTLKEHEIPLDEAAIKKLFASYKKQNEIDFFIHKNARTFLKEQFDLWFYHYLYKDSEFQEWSVKSISHLQKIRNIALEIIGLIGDFEDELKAVWLKPKFVKAVDYVFSLDLILKHSVLGDKSGSASPCSLQRTPSASHSQDLHNPNFSSQSLECQDSNKTQSQNTTLLDSICKDKGFESQIKEWQDLKLIDESFHTQNISENILNDEKYKFLPIDTKHFSKEVKYKILSVFDDIESILNGELIKADNFQALNSLMPKYQNKVDLIYIDPPFNLGENASFDYKVNFKDSTWASLLDSRLELARDILNDKGSIFVRCDYNGNFIVRSLLNNVFGEDNFINEIVVSKSAKLTETIKKYHSGNDSLFFFSKSEEYIFNVQGIKREERKWRAMHLPGERWSPIPNQYIDLFSKENLIFKNNKWMSKARIILGKEYLPPNGRHWALSQETIFELEKQGGVRLIDDVPKTKESDTKKLTSNWTDWVGYSSDWGFQTENHEKVLQRVILTGSNQDSVVLDYHLGSGTTLAVAQKLGRKWLGIEMGEHFYKVIIPRLKKVIAGFQSGISKECNYQGSGAFRYYELESYEEALKECEYMLVDCQCENKAGKEIDNNAEVIYLAKDYQKAQKIIDYRKSRKLIKKLNKGETITLDMNGYRKEFDLFHTLANLQGLKIKRLFLDSDNIESCEFDNGDIVSLDQIDLHTYPKLKNLIFWN